MGKGSSSAPAPDPQIGLAAMKSAETGQDWLNVAKEQFGIANERQAKLDELTSQVTTEQLRSMTQLNDWASQDRERYTSVYQPMEDAFIDKAKNWDSAENQAKAAAEARAGVQNASALAQQTRQR